MKVRRVEELNSAGPAVGHDDGVRVRQHKNALRLVKTSNASDVFAGLEIDHLDGIVAERGHHQTLMRGINREMIDAAVH